MHGESEERQAGGELNVHDLEGMYGGDGEGGRLLVLVVQLVEVLVQPRRVVQPVKDVSSVVLKASNTSIKHKRIELYDYFINIVFCAVLESFH